MKRIDQFFAVGMISILLLALLAAYTFVSGVSYTIALLALLSILYIAFTLYRKFTGNNKRILQFFASLKNGDPSAITPMEEKSFFEQTLAEEMNAIANLVREQKQKNEEQSLYYEGIMKVMTHELRNAMTPVSSLSSVLLTENKHSDNSQLVEDLELIYSQSKILENHLDAYHKLVYLPVPVKETVDLNVFLQRFTRLLQGEEGHEKASIQTSTAMQIQADPNMLTLALLHVVRNGLQAVEDQPEGNVQIRVSKTNPHSIEIEDNGSGIPSNLQSSVFTPFFSTKSTGSGIGLSISNRIMQLHGGTIILNSQPGKTMFELHFKE